MGVQKKETRLAASTSTPQLILFCILFYSILPSSMALDFLIFCFFENPSIVEKTFVFLIQGILFSGWLQREKRYYEKF